MRRNLTAMTAPLIGIAFATQAAPDPTANYTEEQRAWFQSLHPPGQKESCCDISDCREKVARVKGDTYEVYVDDSFKWVKVPPRAILRGTPNPIGRPVLCYQRASLAPPGLNLIIYCFVPADEG